jgi:sugar phosphate permease
MPTNAATGRQRLWYHGWTIVAVAVLSQIAANGLAINSMSLFLQDWARDLHAPVSQLLLAMLPLAIVASVSSPVVGSLADKYPARLLFAAGLAGIALFCLLMSMVTAVWQIWALYGLVFPVSLSLCTSITANAVVSRWFVKRIGLALGITAFGVGIGGAVLPPIIAEAMPVIGWRGIWRVAALLTAVVILPLVFWVVRDRPTERDGLDYLSADGKAPAHSHHGHGQGGGASGLRWTDILKRRNFWLLVCCYLPVVALYGAIQQNMAPIAASHGFDVKVGGLLLLAFSVSHMAATLLLGLASDRFGNRAPLACLGVIITLGAALFAYGSGLPALVAGAVLVGFTGGLWTLLPAAVAVEFGASGVGRAFGALMLFIPINAVAPSVMAKVKEATGSYAPALMGLGVICLLGSVAILFMRERRGGHLTSDEKEAALEDAVTTPTV